MKSSSAYHGPGFKKRTQSLSDEKGHIYSPYSCNSEFGKLEAVMLYCPGKELEKIVNPDAVQHLAQINPKKLRQEFAAIEKAFQKIKIKVHYIKAEIIDASPPPNLMFVRDLFWNGPAGAVSGRMGSVVRAGEERYATAMLSLLNMPVVLGIHGTGLFEGADLLWIGKKTLLCGTGNRTNKEAFQQLQTFLRKEKIKLLEVPLPSNVQHLLGLLQIVDEKKALIRNSIAPAMLVRILKKHHFKLIEIEETDEVVNKQGMNIVTVAPGKIFMPDDCPELKKLYRSAGLKILAELNIQELRKAAGGLACATGILSRKLIHG